MRFTKSHHPGDNVRANGTSQKWTPPRMLPGPGSIPRELTKYLPSTRLQNGVPVRSRWGRGGCPGTRAQSRGAAPSAQPASSPSPQPSPLPAPPPNLIEKLPEQRVVQPTVLNTLGSRFHAKTFFLRLLAIKRSRVQRDYRGTSLIKKRRPRRTLQ